MSKEKPGVCPECGSSRFKSEAPEFTDNDYHCEQALCCLECDCYWYEKYVFETKCVAVHGRNHKE